MIENFTNKRRCSTKSKRGNYRFLPPHEAHTSAYELSAGRNVPLVTKITIFLQEKKLMILLHLK